MNPLSETTASWANTAIWAAVVVFFFVLFRAPITTFLERLSQLKLKADKSGFELTALVEAGASMALAIESRSGPVAADKPLDIKEISSAIQAAASQPQVERLSRSEVLWVDDRPDNNINERRMFEAIGLHFTLARSTEEALDVLKTRSFAAIISDMGRPPDDRAGYTLLDQLRAGGDKTPFIIYAGSRSPEHKQQTEEHLGQGCTNQPDELFTLVTRTIVRGPIA